MTAEAAPIYMLRFEGGTERYEFVLVEDYDVVKAERDDLVMLLRRALVKAEPNLRAQGIDYLSRKGLIGSHLRDGIEI